MPVLQLVTRLHAQLSSAVLAAACLLPCGLIKMLQRLDVEAHVQPSEPTQTVATLPPAGDTHARQHRPQHDGCVEGSLCSEALPEAARGTQGAPGIASTTCHVSLTFPSHAVYIGAVR